MPEDPYDLFAPEDPHEALGGLSRVTDAPARNIGVCDECNGTHWVRIQDTAVTVVGHKSNPDNAGQEFVVPQHHMAPCPKCPSMENRHRLYKQGHFDKDHAELGGCIECKEYYESPGTTKNSKKKG